MNYIILLNYNNWEDTIECLESLLKLKNIDFKIIVCDNNSLDNSLEYIKLWADGILKVHCKTRNKDILNLIYPLEIKPIKYKIIKEKDILIEKNDKKLILIQNENNNGYSAGNNIGIKYAMNQLDCEYIWILNNDTVVKPLSLKYLIDEMKKDPSIGICGSKTYYYYFPNRIQCEGGYFYNKWLGYGSKKKNKLSYINGSSMLVKKDFIQDVGYLSEDYFLYYEEIDWALRGKYKYRLGYSSKSIIYHKEGGSISKEKSLLSDFYSIRNRIIVTKKFYKYCLPTIYLGILIAIFNRLRRKQFKRIWVFIKIMCLLGNYDYKKDI